MFTTQQIHKASSKVKSGADFPRLVQDLKSMGVDYYINYVFDGKTKYVGNDEFVLTGEAKYSPLIIADNSSAEKLKTALSIHQQGQTDYLTFCKQAADAGVEKWRTDIKNMTVAYYDKKGHVLVTESIPSMS
jgi:uncharacterized protein YbcV (DUF1398 family)